MKLSEALILRADTQKRIEQLRQRLIRSAKTQEGETPPEDPQTLISELNTAVEILVNLIRNINQTNSLTNLSSEDSLTIADALAQRDTIMLKRSVLDSLLQAAAYTQTRYSSSEIKLISTVNIAEIQRQIDTLSRDYRELDTQIQQANWNTDLIE